MHSFFKFYLCSCLSFVCVSNSFAQKVEKTEKPLDVIVQPVSWRNMTNDITALGNLHAVDSTAITSKVSKTISAIHFEDGERVNKGTVLVEMINAEESALLDEARSTSNEAKKQLDRTQALMKTGAVSPALLDQRVREYETAKSRYLAVQARLKDLLITAPFSGVIGVRNSSVGNLVSPGQVIATLNDDGKMKLDFTVPALYLRQLHVGLAVEARAQEAGSSIVKGVIASIDNQVDEQSRSIKVRAILDNQTHELVQGMLMSVVVRTESRKTLAISEAALVPMGSNKFVYVLQASGDKNGVAKKQQIEIGKRERGVVEVLSGLQEGDKVVTHGLQKIHDGQTLSILAEQSNDPNKPVETLSELLKQKSSGK